MIKSASVALMISSTETPGARSNNLNLFGNFKTANSVTTFFHNPTPVNEVYIFQNFRFSCFIYVHHGYNNIFLPKLLNP